MSQHSTTQRSFGLLRNFCLLSLCSFVFVGAISWPTIAVATDNEDGNEEDAPLPDDEEEKDPVCEIDPAFPNPPGTFFGNFPVPRSPVPPYPGYYDPRSDQPPWIAIESREFEFFIGGASTSADYPGMTSDPVYLYRGSVIETATDLALSGSRFPWAHQRTYDSLRLNSGNTEMVTPGGLRWKGGGRGPYLTVDGSGNVTLHVTASSKRVFSISGSDYIAPKNYSATLVKSGSGSTEIFTLTETDNDRILIFYGRDTAIALQNRGRLKEQTTRQYDAEGLSGTEYTYTTSGYVDQVTTAEPQSWIIDYSYYASGTETDRLEKIEVKNASSTVTSKVEYTYYGNVTSPSTDLGSDGDLVQVKISRRDSDGTGWTTRTTQYRYYNSSSADGKPHQLKAVLEPDAVLRITSAGNTAVDTADEILTQGDSYTVTGSNDIEDYFSRSFTYYTSDLDTDSAITTGWGSENLKIKYGGTNLNEYDSYAYGRVKSETINGSCTSCGGGGSAGGGIKKTYYYMDLNGGSSTDPAEVVRIVIEDTTDSQGVDVSRKIFGLSDGGTVLRKATIEDPMAATLTVWCKSIIVNSDHRVTERRSPSAHTLVDTDSELKNFLDPTTVSNDSATLNDSDGLITLYEFNSDKRPTGMKVKKGENGTAYYISATDYGNGTDAPKYLRTATYAYPDKTATRSAGKKTTIAYTFWDAGKTQIKKQTITLPSIATSQNGSGTATTSERYYDRLGRLRWTKDGEGYVHYYSYHPDTGGLAYAARDVDPSSLPSSATGNDTKWVSANDDGDTNSTYDSSAKPSRGGGLPTALALVDTREFDDQGRIVKYTEASGAEHHTVYETDRTIIFPYWDLSGDECGSSVRVTVYNDAGQETETFDVAGDFSGISSANGVPNGFSTEPSQSDYTAWTKRAYTDLIGQLDYVDRYHDIPASGAGTLSTNFYRTLYRYDDQGRKEYTVQVVSGTSSSSATEQVNRLLYDVMNRVTEIQTGVSSTSHDMTSDYDTYPTLTTRSKTVYDDGGVGDSLATQTQTFHGSGANDYTGVNRHLTYRGHPRGTEPFYHNGSSETAAGPFSVQDVDWMGKVVASAKYTSNPTWSTVLTGDGYSDYTSTTTNRRSLAETDYDDLSRAYRTKTYAVSSSGTAGDALQTDMYYDRNSRQVAIAPSNSAASETAYDGVGRAYQRRTVLELEATKYSSGAFAYRSPTPHPTRSSMTGGDDKVLTLAHYVFDSAGNATEQHSFEALHDDTDGIDLTANDDYIRGTVNHWYDEADRQKTTGYYGSGDTAAGAGQWKYAAVPTRPASAPTTSSDTVLVTLFFYDEETGRRNKVTDPAGTSTKTFFDDLGRTTWVAENYDNFLQTNLSTIGDATDKSKDRVVKNEYNGLGKLTKLTAYNGSSTDKQETIYLYEDSVSASLLTNEIYPDSSDTTSSGTDQVKFAYHADGSLDTRTDQRGTVITYSYDDLRRRKSQKVTTLGGSTDGAIRSITRGYDSLGRVSKITSHGNQTDDPDNTSDVKNQIVFTHDDLGRVTKSEQSHSGVVGGSTPSVQYSYDTSATSGLFEDGARLEKITYPDGRVLFHDYGTSGGIDDLLSRTYRLRETNGTGTILVEYSHTGGGEAVVTDYQQPDLKLNLYGGTSGTYAGLDRFGRTIDHLWDGYNSTSDAVQIKYGHDYAGNRSWREDVIAENNSQNHDELYIYDALDRLTSIERGEINGTYNTVSSDTFGQTWTLEQLGNWSNFTEDSDGNGTDDLDQDRSHNDANEITDIDSSSTHVGHDAAGNMTTVPQPGSWSTNYSLTWDAWNRLVKVADGATTIAEYEYDGKNRRIVKKIYDGGTLDETQHHYLSNQNQLLEVRLDSDTDPHKQFTWGTRYIDDLVLRERDTTGNGTLDETLYALQDANWNVMALVNASGTVSERFHYAPYGTSTVLDADFTSDSDGVSDYDWEYRYTSREFDAESGIHYYRARYYHSGLGRFCSRDPIGFEGSEWNLYEYIDGRPLLLLDPHGRSSRWNPGGPVNPYQPPKPTPIPKPIPKPTPRTPINPRAPIGPREIARVACRNPWIFPAAICVSVRSEDFSIIWKTCSFDYACVIAERKKKGKAWNIIRLACSPDSNFNPYMGW